jgi:spore germination cell wall hydrolase CwlJ-like protein
VHFRPQRRGGLSGRVALRDHVLANRSLAGVAAAALAVVVSLGLTALARPGVSAKPAIPTRIADLSEAALKRELRGMDPAEQALALRLDPVAHRLAFDRPSGWGRFDLANPPALGDDALSADDAKHINALIPTSLAPEPAARPFVLHASADDRSRAEQCLTQAIYYEAGFEPMEGRAAVAQIVLNRLRHPAFPKSICGVVFQGAQLPTGCQFSFTCDGSLGRQPAAAAWAQAREIAKRALNGYVVPQVGEATHYHADYVVPYWSPSLVKIAQIGAHIFYRWGGPEGAPQAFTGRYAGGESKIATDVLGDLGPQIALQQALKTGQERTVTLSYAGEVRTYKVADPAAAKGVRTRVEGVIYPARRQPTPDEVARINAALPPVAEGPAPAMQPAGNDPKPQ